MKNIYNKNDDNTKGDIYYEKNKKKFNGSIM